MIVPRRWNHIVTAFAAVALLYSALPAETPSDGNRLDFSAVRRSERSIDGRIERYNTESPMEVIGATRAMYISGTGLLFSIEVSLSPAVGISPFFTRMPPGEVEKIHAAKLGRVPVLRQLLLTMLPEMAKSHADVPEGEEIVMGATLFYFPYENREGLPAQMVVRARAGDLRKLKTSGDANDAARVSPIAKITLY
ncbi:MAG: hypothetical protein U5J83_00385 [Bryobacterales bacterium]|nr:hypothetical protein [Bryobacterales bacterium]